MDDVIWVLMQAVWAVLRGLLAHWRIGVPTLGSPVLALWLADRFAWFTFPFGMALVVAALAMGVAWQVFHDAPRPKRGAAASRRQRKRSPQTEPGRPPDPPGPTKP